MKEFPKKLKPQNKHLFAQIRFNELLEEWRIKTYKHILLNNDTRLDICVDNKPIDKRIVDCLRLELSTLGWKTKLGYGGTVLCIYENEEEIKEYKHMLSENVFE